PTPTHGHAFLEHRHQLLHQRWRHHPGTGPDRAGVADPAAHLPDAVCLPQPGPGRTHGARPVAAAAADARCHGRLAETGPGLPGLLLPGSTGCGAAAPVLDARGPGDRRTARFRRPGPGHAGPADGVRPVLRAAVGPVLARAGPGGLARPAPAPGA